MKKEYLYGGAALALLGGGYFFLYKKKPKYGTPPPGFTGPPAPGAPGGGGSALDYATSFLGSQAGQGAIQSGAGAASSLFGGGSSAPTSPPAQMKMTPEEQGVYDNAVKEYLAANGHTPISMALSVAAGAKAVNDYRKTQQAGPTLAGIDHALASYRQAYRTGSGSQMSGLPQNHLWSGGR